MDSNSTGLESYSEHRKFLNKVETKLLKLCKKDKQLSDLFPMLNACKNDPKYNDLISEHLNALVDHHYGRVFKLSLQMYNDQVCDIIYVKTDATVQDLRKSIQRDVSIRVQINGKQDNRIDKIFKKLNWKKIWCKFDVLVDQTTIISFNPPIRDQNLSINSKSVLKLVPKRIKKRVL